MRYRALSTNPKSFSLWLINWSSRVLWPLVRFPLRRPISRPSIEQRSIFSWQPKLHTLHTAILCWMLAFQHIVVFRNTPNCSSVHSGMTGISLSELALHNRCELIIWACAVMLSCSCAAVLSYFCTVVPHFYLGKSALLTDRLSFLACTVIHLCCCVVELSCE